MKKLALTIAITAALISGCGSESENIEDIVETYPQVSGKYYSTVEPSVWRCTDGFISKREGGTLITIVYQDNKHITMYREKNLHNDKYKFTGKVEKNSAFYLEQIKTTDNIKTQFLFEGSFDNRKWFGDISVIATSLNFDTQCTLNAAFSGSQSKQKSIKKQMHINNNAQIYDFQMF